MNGLQKRSEHQAQINVTPLVDVILVLLIIFMVITPLLHMGFTGEVPPRADSPGSAGALVLQIKDDGTFSLNHQRLTEADLGERLSALFSVRHDRALFLEAEDGVGYERLVKVLDTCRTPGRAETIAFILE